MDHEGLARRIETEARAWENADHLTRDLRLGRVLGFLEVGTQAGHWSTKRSVEVADSIQLKWVVEGTPRAGRLISDGRAGLRERVFRLGVAGGNAVSLAESRSI